MFYFLARENEKLPGIFLYTLFKLTLNPIIPFITVGGYLIICDIERDMNEEDRIIRKKYNIYNKIKRGN